MKLIKTITLITVLFCFSGGYLRAVEYYDGVIAVVNGVPVVYSDLMKKFEYVKKEKNIRPAQYNYELSRVLDSFIEDALVYEVAEKESLYVSDERVVNQIKPVTEQFASTKTADTVEREEMIEIINRGVLNRVRGVPVRKRDISLVDEFVRLLETQENKSFHFLFEDLRINIRKEMVMSLSIGITPPTRDEAREWYDRNKGQVGFETRVKHILIRPEDESLAAQRGANNKLEELRRRINSGESFDDLAKKYSEDRATAVKGGDTGWVEMHTLDSYFANQVFQLQQRGQISPVFKSSFGYHIAEFLGRRATSFERVERVIMYKLYQENMEKKFKEWVKEKRAASDIKIFLDNYMEAR